LRQATQNELGGGLSRKKEGRRDPTRPPFLLSSVASGSKTGRKRGRNVGSVEQRGKKKTSSQPCPLFDGEIGKKMKKKGTQNTCGEPKEKKGRRRIVHLSSAMMVGDWGGGGKL